MKKFTKKNKSRTLTKPKVLIEHAARLNLFAFFPLYVKPSSYGIVLNTLKVAFMILISYSLY